MPKSILFIFNELRKI